MNEQEQMENECSKARLAIKEVGDAVKALKNNDYIQGEQAFLGQHGEIHANIMLAYRHLEDARMRVGKVMQQLQGGTSKFDAAEESSIK